MVCPTYKANVVEFRGQRFYLCEHELDLFNGLNDGARDAFLKAQTWCDGTGRFTLSVFDLLKITQADQGDMTMMGDDDNTKLAKPEQIALAIERMAVAEERKAVALERLVEAIIAADAGLPVPGVTP